MLSFFIVQAVIGGAVVLSKIHLVLRGLHLAMAAAMWTATIVMVVLAARVGANADRGFTSNRSERSTNRSAGGAPAVSESP